MGFMKNYYEEAAKEAAKENLEVLNKTEVGKFILCRSKKSEDDTKTRMFINRFTQFDFDKKDGWWDTFTIASKPCENPGLYICMIDTFKIDKNGYLMMIVTPKVYLDEVNEESIAWKYLIRSGSFTNKYNDAHHIYSSRFNVINLHEKYAAELFKEGVPFVPTDDCAKHIMNKLFDGKISFDDIENALNEMDPMEKLYNDIAQNPSSYEEKYPLMIKKLPKAKNVWGEESLTAKSVQDYIETNMITYEKLKLGDDSDLLNRVESVLLHYEEKKLKEKEERKRLRKLAKGQVV